MQIQNDLQFIKEDINAVERHRIELYRARDRYSVKLQMLGDEPTARKSWPSLLEKNTSSYMSSPITARGSLSSGSLQTKRLDSRGQASPHGLQRKDARNGSDSQHINQSSLAILRKKRVHEQVGNSFPWVKFLLCSFIDQYGKMKCHYLIKVLSYYDLWLSTANCVSQHSEATLV